MNVVYVPVCVSATTPVALTVRDAAEGTGATTVAALAVGTCRWLLPAWGAPVKVGSQIMAC